MSGPNANALYHDLESLFESGTLTGLTNRQLLDRFIQGSPGAAESAFAALVERYGPMVWRVCRQILGHTHDSEDAFQATFVVLSRRASAIRRADSLASWLHGVALRACRYLVRSEGRRRRRERVIAIEDESYEPDSTRDDTFRVVHEEVSRLPAKLRDAVMLCYFEGLTHEQTAGRLGCPVGTVHSRLAQARTRLEVRLRQKQLAPSVVLPRVLDPTALEVPASLIASAVRASSASGEPLSAICAAIVHMSTRITLMNNFSLATVGLAATLFVVATADPGVAASPQLKATNGGPQGIEFASEQTETPPARSAASSAVPAQLPSTRTLQARLEAALLARGWTERLANQHVVSTQEVQKVATDVAVIVGEIEGLRDGLRDEVELVTADLEIRVAELESAVELERQLQTAYGQTANETKGEVERAMRLQWVAAKARIPVKAAEVSGAKVKLAQAKRRLTAYEELMKTVDGLNKPVEIKPGLPASPIAPAPPPPAAK